jgi:hypothetical protein
VRLELITQLGMLGEGQRGAGVQRNQPGLAELRLPDQQHALLPVDVGAVKLDGLTDPQAAHRQQPEQSLVGRCPQR